MHLWAFRLLRSSGLFWKMLLVDGEGFRCAGSSPPSFATVGGSTRMVQEKRCPKVSLASHLDHTRSQ